MTKILKVIFLLCLLFVLFVLGSQNPHIVKVNFIVASAEVSLAFIISICCALGVLIGVALSLYLLSITKLQNRRLKKLNQKLSTSSTHG